MVPADGRVVVALSGGPDSVGLVHVLRELQDAAGFTLAGVAHFNHQLRGLDADADEAFCRELAAGLALPIDVGRGDVRGEAERAGRSIEDAARSLRYAFLHEAARRVRADAIAVGHTRDDQAETFLLRLIRGSGPRGLGSIRPKAGMVIRPLLETSRRDLRAFVDARVLRYRHDATNEDVSIPRNRIRHELLPYLEREFSPNIVEVLAREAAIAQVDNDHLEQEAIEFGASIVLTSEAQSPTAADDRIVIDAAALRSLHPAIASRVVERGLRIAARGRFVGAGAIGRLLTFAHAGRPGARLSLPGCEAVHQGDRIRLGPAPPRGVYPDTNSFRIPLSIPGEVVLTPQALALSAVPVDGLEALTGPGIAPGGFVRVGGPLAVRSRRPGDRFQPPGLGGRSKKLQDYFVDRKVARETRDLVPLVVDADDRIIWVVGHGFSEAFRAAGPSPGVILLKARRLGGEV